MKTNQVLFLLLIACLFSMVSLGQTHKSPIEYLQVPGPVVFDKTPYQLVWTSHPTANFYKQEYIAKGDEITRFKTMILLDLITGRMDINEVVATKVAELKRLKEANPVVNYEVFENPKKGEFLIDFLLSQQAPDGKSLSIVERNVYRYKLITGPSGQKGILLFGVSQRSYGTQINQFLTSLKLNKADLINKIGQFTLPAIRVAK